MEVLVTGGLGYIGSHVVIALLSSGYDVIVIDYTPTFQSVIDDLFAITNKFVIFYNYDLRDTPRIEDVFKNHHITKVIHLAALKCVPESFQIPLEYYDTNVSCSIALLKLCEKYKVSTFVFSSTAAVYQSSPKVTEDDPLIPTSPYGQSKLMIENVLHSLTDMNVVILRYFNPIGNHSSGKFLNLACENLMANICQSILFDKQLTIFGGQDTPDGTGIRDYIHVEDVATAHLLVLYETGHHVYNIGTSRGTSTLQLVEKMEHLLNRKLEYDLVGPREGDVAELVCSADKIKQELGWEPRFNLDDMCSDVVCGIKLIH